MTELERARKNLCELLGEKVTDYWTLVKNWYRQKLTKDEFDNEARKILSGDNVRYHNDFIVAILTKCQVLTSKNENSSSKSATVGISMPGKVSKKVKNVKKKKVFARPSFERRFVPVNPMLYIPTELCTPGSGGTMEFCSQSACLPDNSILHGRVLVTAWEWNLDTSAERVVSLVTDAVECVLKNVISAALARKSGYQLRDNYFKHGLGQQVHTPSLRATLKEALNYSATHPFSGNQDLPLAPSKRVGHPTNQESEEEAVTQVAISGQTSQTGPLTLDDVLEALQVHKGVLKSHLVSSAATERILVERWHPDYDELQQDLLLRKQLVKKDEVW
ncbi:putative transcriptional adapter 1-like [Apostichopus japonicus]|uniref:Putative transcriptional adapter 1-like n=1 Tax=Stichopus japonicus TaxID=307972 RepID=A0A2G8KRW8_STIJA|nr:putative transcriptional adapter 1-like [Apostichopus japonicus]